MQRRIPDRPSNEMTANDVAEVVRLVTTDEARSTETDAIDRQSYPDRHPVIRPDHEIILDEL